MTDYGLTKLARLPIIILDCAEQHGMDRRELMRLASLDPRILDDPDSRVPMSSLLKLWAAIAERAPSVAVGVRFGGSVRARQLGIVGYAMYYSRDLRDAFLRLARYIHIISEAVQFEVKEHGEETSLTFHAHPALVALRHPVDAQLAAVLTIGRELSETALIPLEIHSPLPRSDDASAYREVFRCPVHFDCPESAIICTKAQMALPITASDPTLSGYLDQLAGITMGSLGGADEQFVDQVRRALWSELPGGRPNLWRTASDLGISARTMQRRLRETGTSYSALLDELRRELADDLLGDKKLAVAEVAFLLGYSEPSAFQRAFRRWRGVSPRRFRSG